MTGAEPRRWAAAGNDYRGIPDLEPGPAPKIGVVVTGTPGNGPTGENIEDQAYEGVYEVVMAEGDDISTATEGLDILVFIGPGERPAQGWLQAHAKWHRRVGNVVVVGPSGSEAASRIFRGTRLLLGNDEGFAALSPQNVSLRRDAWVENPGLDTVAGWRLWNDGFFFAYEPDAVVIGESAGSSGAQDAPGSALRLADAIPHRRFRHRPSAFHGTPKVSWLIGVTSHEEAMDAWDMCQLSTFPDHEVVIHGPSVAVADFVGVAASNPRLAVVPADHDGLFRAVRASRGELLALLDPRARISPETIPKGVARFEAKPSAPVVRVGYDVEGARYLRLDDLAAIDRELGRDGLPLFAMVTRRELMKDPGLLGDPAVAWSTTLDRCDQSLIVSPLVDLTGPAPIAAGRPRLAEVTSIGLRETAREVVREARRRRAGAGVGGSLEPVADTGSEGIERVSVAYVGFTGHNNLGDEAVRVAIERLMPWADFESDPVDPQLLMVGGGTLINGRRYYLNRMLRQESASVERALFGTGVRSPEYWGVTEPMDDWFSFIDSALFAAVRGPDSVQNLRTLGYGRDLPIIGDPALFLDAPEGSQRVEGRIVVCPVYTSGNLHGGSDDVVFDALARLIEKSRADGREIVMLSAFPQDDRWVIDIMRRAFAPDLPYVAGYEDIDATMGLLASAEVVIGERLHAAIMAAAAGTPFVGLEYRPKMRDFARSVGQEDAVIRTDEMERLDEVFDRVVAEREARVDDLGKHVSDHRARQAEAASDLRRRFLGR